MKIEQHDPLQQLFDEAQVEIPDALLANLASIPALAAEPEPISKWKIAASVPLAAAALALVMPYAIKLWNPFFWNVRLLLSKLPIPPISDLVQMPVQLTIAIALGTVIMGGAAYLIFTSEPDYGQVHLPLRR